MKTAFYYLGYITVAVLFGINTISMLTNATVLIRGSLTGTELEIAFIGIGMLHGAGFAATSLVFHWVITSWNKHQNECVKCSCTKCAKR